MWWSQENLQWLSRMTTVEGWSLRIYSQHRVESAALKCDYLRPQSPNRSACWKCVLWQWSNSDIHDLPPCFISFVICEAENSPKIMERLMARQQTFTAPLSEVTWPDPAMRFAVHREPLWMHRDAQRFVFVLLRFLEVTRTKNNMPNAAWCCLAVSAILLFSWQAVCSTGQETRFAAANQLI